jgi:carboxypeptidase Taq
MHEAGHGLYTQGLDAAQFGTPMGTYVSLGIHESQSRLWENQVGRSRAFWAHWYPRAKEVFPSLKSLPLEEFWLLVNRVKPSHIRVEADEATYGLHIVLRFELEQDLIEGRLAVADLPATWNERFESYLGIPVPNDALGVLQDVHWSAGLIGYFPTYALGNLIAGQLWQQAHADMPELDDQLSAGELAPLREWLRENVHRHGAKFTTDELLKRVVGESIQVAPFVAYLKQKLSGVYGVEL